MNVSRFLWLIITIAVMFLGGVVAATFFPTAMTWAYEKLTSQTGDNAPDYSGLFPRVGAFVFGSLLLGLLGLYVQHRMVSLSKRWGTMSAGDKVTVFIAVLTGVAVSIPFHMLLFAFGPFATGLGFVLTLILVAVSYAMLRGMQDVLPWNKISGAKRGYYKVFDTSVIIDGRVYEVARAGFIDGKIYIPDFVLKELQNIADSQEPHRRQRGRRGLDMLKNLRLEVDVEIGTHDKLAGDMREPVDTRLVRLSKNLGALLVTNDFNLNKVAQVQDVKVLNINDLAMALRPIYLPNDNLQLEIERPGSQPEQGVGFLEDGTMVVVDHADHLIGQTVNVRITQVHQSAAGKMLFAILEEEADESTERNKERYHENNRQ